MRTECIQQLAESGSKSGIYWYVVLQFRPNSERCWAPSDFIALNGNWGHSTPCRHKPRILKTHHLNCIHRICDFTIWCLQDPHYFVPMMSMIAYATPILHMLVPVCLCKYQLGGHNRCIHKVCRCNPGKSSFYMNRQVEKNTEKPLQRGSNSVDKLEIFHFQGRRLPTGDATQQCSSNSPHPE